jgi:predicted RNase H-like HicB family nuclease
MMDKDLKYYQSLNYPMLIWYSPEDKAWLASFPDLPGCMADGQNPEELLDLATIIKDEWLEVAFDHVDGIPEPHDPLDSRDRGD